MSGGPVLSWSHDTLSIDEFLEQYGSKLPALVKISEKNLDAGRNWRNINAVIRVHECEKQPRLLARNEHGQLLSIPIDIPDTFQLIPSKGGKGYSKNHGRNPRQLSDIVGKEILPYTIRQHSPSTLRFHNGDEVEIGAQVGDLLVEKVYAENFLLGNILMNGHMFPTVMVIPALLELQVHVALGVVDGGPEEWEELQKTYAAVAIGIKYSGLENTDVYIKPTENEKVLRHRTFPAVIPSQLEARPPVSPTRHIPSTSDLYFKKASRSYFLGTRQSVATVADMLLDNEALEGKTDLAKPSNQKPESRTISSIEDIPRDLTGLSVDEVVECMNLLNLGHVTPFLRSQQVDGNILLTLSSSTYRREMNLTETDAAKLCKFVHEHWRPKTTRNDSRKTLSHSQSVCTADTNTTSTYL